MKLSQLLFWILETQDFPTNVHLEPNLGMMGEQKKMCTVSFAASVALFRPGLQITCGSSPKPIGFCIRTQHTLTREHQLSNG